MKPQDIFFFIVFVIFLFLRKPKLITYFGILFLVSAIPLFAKHVFFTAERLTWYAGGLFLLSSIYLFKRSINENRH